MHSTKVIPNLCPDSQYIYVTVVLFQYSLEPLREVNKRLNSQEMLDFVHDSDGIILQLFPIQDQQLLGDKKEEGRTDQ